jgi:hypothetical protein
MSVPPFQTLPVVSQIEEPVSFKIPVKIVQSKQALRKQEFLHSQMIQGGTRNILASRLCIQQPIKPILKTKVQGTHHVDRDLKLTTNDTPTGLLTMSLHHEDMQILRENKGVMLGHQEGKKLLQNSCWVCFTNAAKQSIKAKAQVDRHADSGEEGIFRGAWAAYTWKEQDEAGWL